MAEANHMFTIWFGRAEASHVFTTNLVWEVVWLRRIICSQSGLGGQRPVRCSQVIWLGRDEGIHTVQYSLGLFHQRAQLLLVIF